MPEQDVVYYTVSGAPIVYGPGLDRAAAESFWGLVADLAAALGLSLGAGLLECDADGRVLGSLFDLEQSDGPAPA